MIKLEDGAVFDPYRPRSQGTLTEAEILACRRYGIGLAYDCAQLGWVASTFTDDVAEVGDAERLIGELRPRLGAGLADILAALEAGQVKPEQANARADAAAVALCERAVPAHRLEEMDQVHLALQREVNRFFPLGDPAPQRNDGVRFRSWKRGDAAAYLRIFSDPEVWRFLPEAQPADLTEDAAVSMIELANQGHHHEVYAVEKDGGIVGQMRLMFHPSYPGLRSAEVAYVLGRPFWGQGLMSALLGDFTARCQQDRDFDLLTAWIHPDNVGSIRAAERAGYRRDSFAYQDQLADRQGREGFGRYLCYASAAAHSRRTQLAAA